MVRFTGSPKVGKLGLACLLALAIGPRGLSAQPQTARGVVFHDADGNGQREAGEEGLAGIKVSNGREIVRTDAQGRYEIAVADDTTIFVLKPRNWSPPLNETFLPRFFYTHKPAGSPPSRYPGVGPTGPLPASVDFPLRPSAEPDRFEAIFFGDTQPRDLKEIGYIAHDVVAELIGATPAAFGVTLGDIVFDDLEMFEPLNRAIALMGLPWYNVIGNHDLNYDAPEDRLADETFERIYGPPYYSFDHGPVHFLVLDNVRWYGRTETRDGHYRPGLGEDQLEFIRNDLALIPGDQLLVLMMHIPLTARWEGTDRDDLFGLIERRPLCFSVSAHTHWQAHQFLTAEQGWRGPAPHHHLINVTVCGSWWSGEPDETGIPHATMQGGAPNGYSIITFDGGSYSIRYKAARRPADYQMHVWAPEVVPSRDPGLAEVLVNVFAGSERSKVEMRVGEAGPWVELHRTIRPDPFFVRMKQREEAEGPSTGYRRLPAIQDSQHLWQGFLPENLAPGAHVIHVRTTDMFGQTYSASRAIQVR